MAHPELQQAISTIKSGDKEAGRQLLLQLLALEPDNESVWLWLATATDDRTEKICCLSRALELNPASEIARQGINRLVAAPPQPLQPTSAPVPLTRLKTPVENTTGRQCPYCAETIKAEAIVCRYCGRDLVKQTVEPAVSVAQSWDEVWFRAVSQPSIATFERILADPQAAPNRAYRWILISSLVGAALGFLLQLMTETATTGNPGPATLTSLVLGVTVGPLVTLAGMSFMTALTQSVARGSKGQGTYAQLIYARAAYIAPLGIVMAALAAVPYTNALSIPLFIYTLILDLLALRAVNRFGWGAALSALIFPGVIVGLVFGCAIVLFSFLGVAVPQLLR